MRTQRRGFSALGGRQTVVATTALFDDAVAELSIEAMAFLWRVHSGDAPCARTTANVFLRRLAAISPIAQLRGMPAWESNITTWRAIARLAGADVP